MPQQKGNQSATENLCLSCGLCCNGVIFADVKLHVSDNAARLEALGIKLAPGMKHAGLTQTGLEFSPAGPGFQRFLQPCCALEGCRCRIYAERPQHCRQFECQLLQRLLSGKVAMPLALEVVTTARQRAEEVLQLLRQLNDKDEQLALRSRFRRTARRLESTDCGPGAARLYGQLTVAMHELNLMLSESFYR